MLKKKLFSLFFMAEGITASPARARSAVAFISAAFVVVTGGTIKAGSM